ncbi:uncharacterized protein PAC_16956 [Phialocephala subalpina]|uniref:Ubiquitin-like domain-containing protein n=1 Tax=Phialocephala subalpina TaxID=576137 RepID=A0A1L7XQ44_9HELO|nr:uncharacterized protein PAC_16956 [Phialocephala subalpina]
MSSSSRIPRIPQTKPGLTSRFVQDSNLSISQLREPSVKSGKQSRPPDDDIGTGSSVDHEVDELSNNGFIKLNTHDVSFVEEHVPGIERFAKDLQSAINAAWPTRRKSRYDKAHVLLLSWDDDNLGVYQEMHRLEYVFSSLYRFNVQRFKIPRKTAGKATTARILSFLEEDGPETLFVVYYAGHARLSHRSSEPPIWSATDKPDSPTLPSGGVQQLFEEAESDVLLLYDTCHSSHPAVNVGGQGVTEVIAACGFETQAPAVGAHSFTNALIRELEEAFNGPPISVAELHGRVIGSLKSWKPGLLRDKNGNVWTDDNGRPRYECHKRRTPVHCFLTNENPYRSIMLAPLPSKLSHSAVANIEQSESLKSTAPNSLDTSQLTESSDHSTAATTISDSSKGARGPQVLLAVRLEDDYFLNGQESEDAKKFQTWCDWLKSAPDGTKDITIQGVYKSFSTLVLISIPVVVWDILPDNAGYSFIGFVQSGNLAKKVLGDEHAVLVEVPNHHATKSEIVTSRQASTIGSESRLSRQSLTSKSQRRTDRDSGFSELRSSRDIQPIIVTDPQGKTHHIPYQLCSTWAAFDDIMKHTFRGSDMTGKAVQQGLYQLLDQHGTIILPQKWQSIIQPGSSLKLHIWQGPVLSKPLTPPPIRELSPSPQRTNRRSSGPESLQRQRTLKRRPGFILPKPPANRPPSPDQSDEELFAEAREFPKSKTSFPPRWRSPTKAPPKNCQSPKLRSQSSPPPRSRVSYPSNEKARDTRRFETWSGFSKPVPISEVTLRPVRARSLQEKYVSRESDPYAYSIEVSGIGIARAATHRLRKEKRHEMLKIGYSGSITI